MPNFTKKAIKETFIKLLDERPLNQITVKDIVEDCGINRNSFYYHYADLPALLEEVVAEDLKEIMESHPTVASLEEGFDTVVESILRRKRAVLHIYNSLSRDVFQRYLMDVCQYVVAAYVGSALEGREMSGEDKAVFIRYHKCACFGAVIDWLSGGMKDDITAFFRRIYQLKLGWEPVEREQN